MKQFKKSPKVVFLFILIAIGLNACKDDEPADPAPELKLSGISPETGPTGTIVTLSGENFSEVASENEVTFNGLEAEVTEASATSIKAIVPEGATTGEVRVIVGGRVVKGPVFTVEAADPAISGIAPEGGLVGTVVTISGAHFSEEPSENKVTFSGMEAEVTEASAISLKAVVPEGATTGEIEVTVDGKAVTGPVFTVKQPEPVISGFAPESGRAGEEITISGENFSEVASENIVTLNGKEAEVIAASETELTVKVPSRAGSGPVVITVGEATTEGGAFEYIPTVTVSTVAGSSVAGHKDGAAEVAQFSSPNGVAVDESGNIYVADRNNHSIRKIDAQGTVTTLAGNGTPGYSNGTGDQARFDNPVGLILEAGGDLAVTDAGNHRIRRVSTGAAGLVSTFAGSGTAGAKDGTGIAAEFNYSYGLTADAAGNLYVGDARNHLIRKISPQGVVTTLAGSGTEGYADGVGGSAMFDFPTGLGIDPEGNIYVADAYNHRIRKVSPSGEVSTVAGNGIAGFANGQGTGAQFNLPVGVVGDSKGNIYVADYGNHQIRMISPSGKVSTLAGTGAAGYADGAGDQAQFNYPFGLAIDQEGNVVVVDAGNNRIRKITIE